MSRKTNVILLVSLLFICCNSINKKNEDLNIDCNQLYDLSSQANKLWGCLVTQKDDSLQFAYTKNVVKVNAHGDVLTGLDAIKEFYNKNGWSIDSVWTSKNVLAHKERGYEYEIGGFFTSEGKKYNHLIIWKTIDGKRLREFEFIAEHGNQDSQAKVQIDRRRELWIELCNQYMASNLVTELYTENAVYYNHRPVIVGTTAITKEYQYMNNPNYRLNLSPLHLEIVNDSLAFELGKCDGSYNLNYLIVWFKNKNGVWKVLTDSNI